MLASYNPEYGAKFFWNKSVVGGWHNPFGNINWAGNIKDSIMPELAGLDKITSVEIIGNELDDLRGKYGLVQGEGLKFVQSIKEGSVNLKVGENAFQGYQRCLVETSVKTKALSLATKALSTIGWMALITAVTWGVSKLGEYLHSFTAEGHIEKLEQLKSEYGDITSEIESLNDELKTTNDRIQELKGKGKLTFTEQEELDGLKDAKQF